MFTCNMNTYGFYELSNNYNTLIYLLIFGPHLKIVYAFLKELMTLSYMLNLNYDLDFTIY